MADETTTTETTTEEEQRIPRSRLNQEIEKRRQAEKDLADLRGRLEQLEDSGKSDVERLSKQVEKLQAERDRAAADADKARAEATQAARRGIVSDAAAKLGFRNPADASLFVNLDEIEDAAAAERALKQVVKDRDYLVQPKPTSTAGLERIATPGQDGGQADTQRRLTPEELNRMHGEEIYQAIAKATGREPAPSTQQ